MEMHCSCRFEQRQPRASWVFSVPLCGQLVEGERLDLLDETRAPGTTFNSATQIIVQFVRLVEHRYDLTPSRRLLAKHHQNEVPVPDDKDEYAGQLERLIGLVVDAKHITIVIRTQHIVHSAAYGPYFHCENDHLKLLVVDHAVVKSLVRLRCLRHLVSVSAAADQHEWLVGVGVDTRRKTAVFRTQRAVAIFEGEPHRYHRGDGHLMLLVLYSAAARLPRLATVVNTPMHLRRSRHLASVSAGQHEQLVWAGVDAGHETFVVRILRVVLLIVRGPHRPHRGDDHLTLLDLDRSAARLPRLAANPAANTPTRPLLFGRLASLLLKTHRKPARALTRIVGVPVSP